MLVLFGRHRELCVRPLCAMCMPRMPPCAVLYGRHTVNYAPHSARALPPLLCAISFAVSILCDLKPLPSASCVVAPLDASAALCTTFVHEERAHASRRHGFHSTTHLRQAQTPGVLLLIFNRKRNSADMTGWRSSSSNGTLHQYNQPQTTSSHTSPVFSRASVL